MNKAFLFMAIFIMCIGVAYATPVEEYSCVTVTGCVDGSDYVYLSNGQLSLSHGSFDPMGHHSDCSSEYTHKIYIDGIAHDLTYDEGYLIDGNSQIEVDTLNIFWVSAIQSRGSVTFMDATTIFIDDNNYGGASVYSIELCGTPNIIQNDVPEFGLLGAGLVVLGGAAFLIFRKN